ncbi:MAG: hypothetical protein JO034_18520, partial [Singulisphaera sp.]|nr:hypothetical protein [Singulisphaera sp.]
TGPRPGRPRSSASRARQAGLASIASRELPVEPIDLLRQGGEVRLQVGARRPLSNAMHLTRVTPIDR